MPENISNNPNLPLVIYIISDKRSGSTLLDYLLSCHPDVTPLGELRLLFGHYHKIRAGARWNWNCSCGQPVASCGFWTKIFEWLNVKEAPDTFIEKSIATINPFESAKKKIKNGIPAGEVKEALIKEGYTKEEIAAAFQVHKYDMRSWYLFFAILLTLTDIYCYLNYGFAVIMALPAILFFLYYKENKKINESK